MISDLLQVIKYVHSIQSQCRATTYTLGDPIHPPILVEIGRASCPFTCREWLQLRVHQEGISSPLDGSAQRVGIRPVLRLLGLFFGSVRAAVARLAAGIARSEVRAL